MVTQREKGARISGPMLQKKPYYCVGTLFPEETEFFTAGSGWLDRWKKRYAVRQVNACEEKFSANDAIAIDFGEHIQKLVAEGNYSPEHLVVMNDFSMH